MCRKCLPQALYTAVKIHTYTASTALYAEHVRQSGLHNPEPPCCSCIYVTLPGAKQNLGPFILADIVVTVLFYFCQMSHTCRSLFPTPDFRQAAASELCASTLMQNTCLHFVYLSLNMIGFDKKKTPTNTNISSVDVPIPLQTLKLSYFRHLKNQLEISKCSDYDKGTSVAQWQRAGLLVNRSSSQSCIRHDS